MRIRTITLYIVFILCPSLLQALDYSAAIERIREGLNDPGAYLKKDGPLIVLGNAPLDQAKIVFLPEIHDDPKSLMTQLLVIALEKRKNQPFLVLDESLTSHKKSMWDIFSQKSMEIIAATDQRQSRQNYVPQKFEAALQNLATKFRNDYRQLNFLTGPDLWALNSFYQMATPFFGWDTSTKASLVERNVQMVNTIERALQNNDRILVMAGARHIPELEFITSQRLLCQNGHSPNMGRFFNTMKQRFGDHPNLRNGIGATTPIYDFLQNQRYAIVFQKPLYHELDRIVGQFKENMGARGCMRL